MFEALAVILVVAVVIYGAMLLIVRPRDQRTPELTGPGEWRVAHYDVKGATKVALQKVAASGASILDEHVIAVIETADPEYDAKFMAAMDTARERRAMFESEDD
jgi:hypothetical protein